MTRPVVLLVALVGLVSIPVLGCSKGEVDAGLDLYLSSGNLDYYEDVLFPNSRREVYDEIFNRVPLHLPLHLPYQSSQVDALISQRGDLQITVHLTAGEIFREELDSDEFDYLDEEQWNGESEEDRWGEEFRDELSELDRTYRGLDEDLRLILLVNLPEGDDPDDVWDADEWEYPAELWANYMDTYLDEEEQEHSIPEDEIQLMSRMIIGGELFETINGERYDEELGTTVEDTQPHVTIEELTMPAKRGQKGHVRGTFDLYLEAVSFVTSSGFASISGEFDVDVRNDPWALDDLDVQEDLVEP